MTQQQFGIALRTMRQALGLSQLALATRLSSTQRHISFLETGRSRITPDFLRRLVTELNLSAEQRSALFDASEFRNPYPSHGLGSDEMAEALDTVETRVLANWPFPAFALDRDWTVLRANTAAKHLFKGFGVDLDDGDVSLLALVLSPAFKDTILNWEDASLGFYFRLQAAATRNEKVKSAFESARTAGMFDHIARRITDGAQSAPLSPVIMGLPNGVTLQLTPLVGQLVTVQDVRLEAVEIEFMVPLDDPSEAFLKSLA